MAIIKTHFFNISFEQKDLIKMLIKMTEYQEEMFPQDSKKIAHNVKGVSVMDDVNPYNEPLDNIYHIFNRLSLDTRVKDNEFEEINLFEVNKLIDEINEKIDNIINVREDIIKEKHENDEAIVLLKNLKDSKISVDDVQNTKYITCRFGKIPLAEFNKIQYYRDYEFIFVELNRSKQYVWIVYAGLTNNISEIDNAFSSMSFEQINIPEFAHGKVCEAIDELNEESTAMEQYIKKMDTKIEEVKNEYSEKLLEVFTRLYNLKRLYDKCVNYGIVLSKNCSDNYDPNTFASGFFHKEIVKHEENKKLLTPESWDSSKIFYRQYMSDPNMPLYVEMDDLVPDFITASNLVRKAGGLVFIPHIFEYRDNAERILNYILDNYKIDGIECYYTTFTQEQHERVLSICKEKNLFVSGGSDFHGTIKPDVDIGVGYGNLRIPDEILNSWINNVTLF